MQWSKAFTPLKEGQQPKPCTAKLHSEIDPQGLLWLIKTSPDPMLVEIRRVYVPLATQVVCFGQNIGYIVFPITGLLVGNTPNRQSPPRQKIYVRTATVEKKNEARLYNSQKPARRLYEWVDVDTPPKPTHTRPVTCQVCMYCVWTSHNRTRLEIRRRMQQQQPMRGGIWMGRGTDWCLRTNGTGLLADKS